MTSDPFGRNPYARINPLPSGALLSAIVNATDDGILSRSLDGKITSWNQGAQRIFGYAEAEIVGEPILTLFPEHLYPEEGDLMARVLTGRPVAHFESVRKRKDGSLVPVALTISPVIAPDGTVIGASSVVRDISAAQEARLALYHLAAIVESSDDAIVSKSLSGTITSWNAAARRMFGYEAAEIVGRSILTLIPPALHHQEPEILASVQRGERIDHFETERLHKNGTAVPVSLTISPVRDETGRVIDVSKIIRDISRELRVREQMTKANEELKRADRMKSEFLAVMSHELRTPLNAIIGFTALLRGGRQGSVNDEQKQQLNLIHASGKHLLTLINDLLDLSRIEAGRMDVEAEEVVMADVVEEAIRTVELPAAQKQLEVRRSVEVTGPIRSDRKRLFQIVLNLLNNAVKFTPRGHVMVRVSREAGNLVIRVSDTGIGIAKERQAELFQAFSQIETSSRRRFDGTGLGLYLCRKLAGLLQGEIALQSAAGLGSTFTVRIPWVEPALPAVRSA